MNQQEPIAMPGDSLDVDVETISSVEDFIKELEAKEKDLHITPDLTIEVEQSEFDPATIPPFVEEELNESPGPAAEGRPAGTKTRIYELEQEIGRLNERIAGLRVDRNDIQEKGDRRLKDFENYKY